MANIEQLELTADNGTIHCEACEKRIETVLKTLPGVLQVKADHKTQNVRLTLNTSKTPVADVRAKLEAAGYPAI